MIPGRRNGLAENGGERLVADSTSTVTAPTPSDSLQQLIAVVAKLRSPDGGCPWDREQTHASLVPYVLEEAHEVADSINQSSIDGLLLR